jgi:TolB-like protein/Tfp pilus assembly protein PilF
MGEEPPSRASTPTGAVFLSYASQDAPAAQKICAALHAAGIEVWFDQSELRGGDAWDHQIRDRIRDCRLFVAVISVNTEHRDEGYFRREWSLAVDRTRDMVHNRAFLVPVAIDGTPERGAAVPDKFHELQWTRLPGGETPAAFVERIARLLTPGAQPVALAPSVVERATASPVTRSSLSRAAGWGALGTAVAVCAYFLAAHFWPSLRVGAPTPPATPAAQRSGHDAAAFGPPPHSIAVLPFVNMSGDKEQEYFSDGLTEELLNSLARINELQVAGRTSSFYFKGEHADLATIARKLNVAAVLEGSVRRSDNTLRVTAQLIDSSSGFHLWSQTYDRNLGDVLKLQTEIADAVARALQVTLLGDTADRIELGGTRNAGAFDAYLRGATLRRAFTDAGDVRTSIAAYAEAIRLDPHFALAFAGRSLAYTRLAEEFATGGAIRDGYRRAREDASAAVALAGDLAEAHLALAQTYASTLDFVHAMEESERAVALAPGRPEVLLWYGEWAVQMRRTAAGLAAVRRAVQLDPLNRNSHSNLGLSLYRARRYQESIAATEAALNLDPRRVQNYAHAGLAYYVLGDYERGRSLCEPHPTDWQNQQCLALTYHKLGRHADAEAILARMLSTMGEAPAYQYAQIYAQWGDTAKALDWLEVARRLPDAGLAELRVDVLIDPLRREPRFLAIERSLAFPD